MKKILGLSLVMLMCISAHGAAVSDRNSPEWQLANAVNTHNKAGVQTAIYNGATNVADVLKTELVRLGRTRPTIDEIEIVKVLVDNGGGALNATLTDKFLQTLITYQCVDGKKTSLKLSDIVKMASWEYDAKNTLGKFATIVVQNDSRPDVVECIFNQVSANKLAGVEFLDQVAAVAETNGAVNIIAFINNLRAEIAKIQVGDK